MTFKSKLIVAAVATVFATIATPVFATGLNFGDDNSIKNTNTNTNTANGGAGGQGGQGGQGGKGGDGGNATVFGSGNSSNVNVNTQGQQQGQAQGQHQGQAQGQGQDQGQAQKQSADNKGVQQNVNINNPKQPVSGPGIASSPSATCRIAVGLSVGGTWGGVGGFGSVEDANCVRNEKIRMLKEVLGRADAAHKLACKDETMAEALGDCAPAKSAEVAPTVKTAAIETPATIKAVEVKETKQDSFRADTKNESVTEYFNRLNGGTSN